MSWEQNKGLFVGLGVALAVALVVHFAAAAPGRSAAQDLERANAEARAQMVLRRPDEFVKFFDERRSQPTVKLVAPAKPGDKPSAEFKAFVKAALDAYAGGEPSGKTAEEVVALVVRHLTGAGLGQTQAEALKAAADERKRLQAEIRRAAGLLMPIPDKYVIPKSELDPRLFFEKRLAELRERCTPDRYPPYLAGKSCPVGFSADLQGREGDLKVLLERLAAADRLTATVDAVAKTAAIRVLGITHGAPVMVSAPNVSQVHLRELPMTIRAVTDEKGLTGFVEEISREGSFLALQTLDVEVTDPKSRTLVMKAEVLAVMGRQGAGAKGPAGGGPTPVAPAPVGRY